MPHKNTCTSVFEQKWVIQDAQAIADTLTLDEKVAQCFQIDPNWMDPNAISELGNIQPGLNSVVAGDISEFCQKYAVNYSLFGPFPDPETSVATYARRKDAVDALKASVNTAIPSFIGHDYVHGAGYGAGTVVWPVNRAFSTIDPDEIEEIAEREGKWTAYNALQSGVNLIYGPSVIQALNRCFGRVSESPATDTERCYRFARGFIRGCQSINPPKKNCSSCCCKNSVRRKLTGVVGTCKHFFGDGSAQLSDVQPFPGVVGDKEIQYGTAKSIGAGDAGLEQLLKNSTAGFRGGIDEDTAAIMDTYSGVEDQALDNSYAGSPQSRFIHLSAELTRLLTRAKNDESGAPGFDHKGMVMQDLGADLVISSSILGPAGALDTKEKILNIVAYSFAIGHDLLYSGANALYFLALSTTGFFVRYQELVDHIVANVSEDRINEAVNRVLRVKVAMGLFDANRETLPAPGPANSEAIEAFDIARKSLIYTTGELRFFPKPSEPIINDPGHAKTVLILGRKADTGASAFPGSALNTVRWNAFYDAIGLQNGSWNHTGDLAGALGNGTVRRTLSATPVAPFGPDADNVFGDNINDIYSAARALQVGTSSDTGFPIYRASTILDGFSHAGATAVVVDSGDDLSSYNDTNAIGVVVIGEVGYGERDGQITDSDKCDVFDVILSNTSPTASIGVFRQEGVKIDSETFETMRNAHEQGIPMVGVVLHGRDWTHWNTNKQMNPSGGTDFDTCTFSSVTESIVYASWPGTSGGDAIVDFLYNTPLKFERYNRWFFTSQGVQTVLPGENDCPRDSHLSQKP